MIHDRIPILPFVRLRLAVTSLDELEGDLIFWFFLLLVTGGAGIHIGN